MALTFEQQKDFELIIKEGAKLAEQYPEIFASLSDPNYSVGDLDLNSRVLNNWEQKGLLLREFDSGKHKRFDLIDAIWLKIIQKMRKFEISLKVIHNLKNLIFDKVELNDANKEAIEKTVLEIFGEDKRHMALAYMQSNEFKKQIESVKISFLQMILIDIILLRNKYSLIIFSDDVAFPFKHTAIDTYKEVFEKVGLFDQTFLSISLNELLAELIENLSVDECQRLSILSKEEGEVLSALRLGGVRSVEVNLSKNGKPEKLIIKKVELVDGAKRLNEIILNQSYENITVKTEKGKVVYCERHIKKKI